jgi:hypothetical protein
VIVALLLALQGALGAIDTLLNHEWLERLPRRPEVHAEIGLHALRETTYALLFGGIAWFAWHGALAWLPAALVAWEVLVTATDEAVENRVRVLPQNERVMHVLLTLNLGAIIAFLVPQVLAWSARPTGLERADHGFLSWILTLFALASAAWAVRDFIAWRRLRRAAA